MGLARDPEGIDLNCAECGELRLDAGGMTCVVCGDVKTVCFKCIDRSDNRRVELDDSWWCPVCLEALDDD